MERDTISNAVQEGVTRALQNLVLEGSIGSRINRNEGSQQGQSSAPSEDGSVPGVSWSMRNYLRTHNTPIYPGSTGRALPSRAAQSGEGHMLEDGDHGLERQFMAFDQGVIDSGDRSNFHAAWCPACCLTGQRNPSCRIIVCQYCAQLGHTDQQCPERQEVRDKTRQQIEDQQLAREMGLKSGELAPLLRCRCCWEPGHAEIVCPTQECQYCREVGHRWFVCDKLRAARFNQHREQYSQDSPRTPRQQDVWQSQHVPGPFGRTCTYCEQQGHDWDVCPRYRCGHCYDKSHLLRECPHRLRALEIDWVLYWVQSKYLGDQTRDNEEHGGYPHQQHGYGE